MGACAILALGAGRALPHVWYYHDEEDDARNLAHPRREGDWGYGDHGHNDQAYNDQAYNDRAYNDCAYNDCGATASPPRAGRAGPAHLIRGQGDGGKVSVIDLTSLTCGPRVCAPVVGNVLVFFDQHHMTAAYSQTLAPFLAKRLLAVSPVLHASA